MSEVLKICIATKTGDNMQDISNVQVLSNKGILNDRYFNENNKGSNSNGRNRFY